MFRMIYERQVIKLLLNWLWKIEAGREKNNKIQRSLLSAKMSLVVTLSLS